MNAYEERLARRRERLLRIAEKLEREGDARYQRARQMAQAIPFGQPILVGHYSEQRDRRYRERIHQTYGKALDLLAKARELRAQAEAVGSGGISSDDPEAVDKLREKLEGLRQLQERMKAANAAIRRHAKAGREAQAAALVALGFSEPTAYKLLEPDFCGRIGFPDYALKNNGANIRRIEARIAQLEARKKARESLAAEGKEAIVEERAGFQIVTNYAANRLQIVFPGKPAEGIRVLLKRAGMRWSPSEGAWQCQLGGMAAANVRGYLVQQIEQMLGKEAA